MPTPSWKSSLVVGKYDIVIDVNGNGKYDVGIDVLDDNDVQVNSWVTGDSGTDCPCSLASVNGWNTGSIQIQQEKTYCAIQGVSASD